MLFIPVPLSAMRRTERELPTFKKFSIVSFLLAFAHDLIDKLLTILHEQSKEYLYSDPNTIEPMLLSVLLTRAKALKLMLEPNCTKSRALSCVILLFTPRIDKVLPSLSVLKTDARTSILAEARKLMVDPSDV